MFSNVVLNIHIRIFWKTISEHIHRKSCGLNRTSKLRLHPISMANVVSSVFRPSQTQRRRPVAMDEKNELVIRKRLRWTGNQQIWEFPIFKTHLHIFILTNFVSIICYKSLGLFWGLVVEPKVKEMKVKGPNGSKRFGDEDFYFCFCECGV